MHPAALVPFDSIRRGDDWRRWGELTALAPPFLTPEFFALIKPLVRDGKLIVAQAWAQEAVVGALPLVLDGDTFHALRCDHSPSYDYCGTPEGIASIWACLRDDARWNELVLDRVPSTSVLATVLPQLAGTDGCPAVVRPDARHPYFALPGFEAKLNTKFRVNVQRCARKAGELELERIVVPTRADVDEATAIEAMGWKSVAGTNIAADPRVDHIYRALGRLLGPRGRSALYFLRVAGRRIATMFAVEDSKTLFALKIGFDPQYANLSPGHLLTWKVALDAEKRGLVELDFAGREDAWKRKWTEQVHEHVTIVIYRRSARGLMRYGLREVIKPRLPEPLRYNPKSPLPRRCQQANILGDHSTIARVRGRIGNGLGLKTGIKHLFKRPPPRARLGAPSKFAVGSWVRVIDADRLRATLDDRGRTRGLVFVAMQFETCGKVFRVQRQVRRIRDDHGGYRPVSHTVLLEDVDCSGHGAEPAGCGRHCPLMYRDAWLEPAEAPRILPPLADRRRHARVRDASEIESGLDLSGRRDGLTFMPEMAAHAGKRVSIAQTLTRVYEYDRWIETRRPLYILDGIHCSGSIAGKAGPCDRACAVLWHEDWLIVEPDSEALA